MVSARLAPIKEWQEELGLGGGGQQCERAGECEDLCTAPLLKPRGSTEGGELGLEGGGQHERTSESNDLATAPLLKPRGAGAAGGTYGTLTSPVKARGAARPSAISAAAAQ